MKIERIERILNIMKQSAEVRKEIATNKKMKNNCKDWRAYYMGWDTGWEEGYNTAIITTVERLQEIIEEYKNTPPWED